MIKDEVNLLSRIQHPSLVHLLNTQEIDGQICLIYDHSNGGTLMERLEKEGRLPEHETIKMMTQLLEAMVCLKKHRTLHRNINPQNILIHDNRYILGYLSQCKTLRYQKTTKSFLGTRYMSPEMLHKQDYNEQNDVWSLGVVAYEALHGHLPCETRGHNEMKRTLDQIEIDVGESFVSSDMHDLLNRMLEEVPEKRISMEESLRMIKQIGESCKQKIQKETEEELKNEEVGQKKKVELKKKVLEIEGKKYTFTNKGKLNLRYIENKNMSPEKKEEIERKAQSISQNMQIEKIRGVQVEESMAEVRGESAEKEFHGPEKTRESADQKNIKINSGNTMLQNQGDESLKQVILEVISRLKENEEETKKMKEKNLTMESEIKKLGDRIQDIEIKYEQIEMQKTEQDEIIKNLEGQIKIYEKKTEETSLFMKKEKSWHHHLNKANIMEDETQQKYLREDQEEMKEVIIGLEERLSKIEDPEYTRRLIGSWNKTAREKEKEQIQNLEHGLKGVNKKIEKIAWIFEENRDQSYKIEELQSKIIDIESWRLATVRSINNKVIPTIARLRKTTDWLTKKTENLNRYIGANNFICNGSGELLTINTVPLEQTQEVFKETIEKTVNLRKEAPEYKAQSQRGNETIEPLTSFMDGLCIRTPKIQPKREENNRNQGKNYSNNDRKDYFQTTIKKGKNNLPFGTQ